jgi:hypothetical protein
MNLWQLTHSDARLTVGSLTASVDLMNPARGIHNLAWNTAPIAGSLLGVTVAEEAASPIPLSTEGIDQYARGNDLVANYPQSQSQRFTLQVYWRIARSTANLIVIDAIVSLQTSLLECFPRTLLSTQLPQGDVLAIAGDGSSALALKDRFTSDEPAGVLVRCDGEPWSYFEVTHPTDLGCWRVTGGDSLQIERELGGEFQEKGVIRRLRVRGAFLTRENDEQVAREILAEFAAAEPPLTA